MVTDHLFSRMIKICLALGVLLLGLSFFFYFIIHTPAKERQKTRQKIAQQYEAWQEEKASEEVTLVAKDLSRRWDDYDTQLNDGVPYHGVSSDEKPRIVYVNNGHVFQESFYTKDVREAQIQSSLANEADSDKREKIKILARQHPDWLAYHIYEIVDYKVSEGMNNEMVRITLGTPDKIVTRKDYEMWWYWTGQSDYIKTRDLLVFHQQGKLLMIYSDR